MRTAVVTVAAGRHDHLRRQRDGLAASTRPPDRHVVVAMGDPELAAALTGAPCTDVSLLAADRARLPLAAARNHGAARAVAAGAELLVFLDVDVVPGPALLERYAGAARTHPDRLLSGPVAYLPPGVVVPPFDAHPPHPARPVPPDGQVWPATDPDLFWSLSFALTPATWERVGGFHEGYLGYGGEDTDFAACATRAGVGLAWVGGATGYHQFHPVSSPPVEHLDDVLTNGALFARRWGRWPMTGWLERFEADGLVERTADGWRRAG